MVKTFVQNVVTGVVILGDKRAVPILPRWVGYMNLWTGVLLLPGLAVGLFKVGPFAWNGALAFWMPAVVFGNWFNPMIFAMLAAIKRNALAGDCWPSALSGRQQATFPVKRDCGCSSAET